ncbi:MAG: FAD:protein FMN transferase [Treponema sp.]|nr:FAD:protein FMN transferase [Treponema sp.]
MVFSIHKITHIFSRYLLIHSILFSLAACNSPESSHTELVFGGVVCTITLFEQGKDSVYRDIFSRLREIENLMSVNIPSSDVSRINAAAGVEPVQVHDDVLKVIERALYYAQLSGGAFDLSIGPLVSLWGIDSDNERVPSQTEIDKVLPLINWRNIELEPQTKSIYLKNKGMSLDLGAITKGYAADEAAVIIKKANIDRAIIDLSGNILILGEKKDKSLWKVGVQDPGGNRGSYMGILQTTEITVVTSGVYERFFEEDGTRYHHIFSPSGGFPVNNGLLSVTIIAHNSMNADALSTAIFVLGYEKGISLIESLPETEAIFIFEDYSVRKTTGVNFTITDNSYRLID